MAVSFLHCITAESQMSGVRFTPGTKKSPPTPPPPSKPGPYCVTTVVLYLKPTLWEKNPAPAAPTSESKKMEAKTKDDDQKFKTKFEDKVAV